MGPEGELLFSAFTSWGCSSKWKIHLYRHLFIHYIHVYVLSLLAETKQISLVLHEDLKDEIKLCGALTEELVLDDTAKLKLVFKKKKCLNWN